MQISYNWLKQFIKLDIDPEETAEILTNLGLEVEGIEAFESLKGGLKGVVVGHVIACEQHPNADKLRITKVDLGNGEPAVQIVCGAPNVAEGQRVVVAKIGAVMPSGLVIQHSELRGVPSEGMICSARELALPNAPQEKGILVLDEGYEIGQAFPLNS